MVRKIILVHGLGGTADKTWGKFPEFLRDDSDINAEVIQYGYESDLWKFWKRSPSILNIANGLWTDIKYRCDLEKDELILVGHSLGGLIIKQLLLSLSISKKQHNIKKVCFFDVPHDGSAYANIAKVIVWGNRHLKSLCRDSGDLDHLNEQWVDSGIINDFEIQSVVCANDSIVSSSSSKSIYRGSAIATINEATHVTIVKPNSTNDIVYIVLKDFVLRKTTVLSLKNPASRDLVDWQRVDRPHNLQFVSDPNRDLHLSAIVQAIRMNPGISRITGASGLGKTRTLLEAIKQTDFTSKDILMFNAARNESEARDAIRKAVKKNIYGLIVVEECNASLHNEFVRELRETECQLSIVTIGFFHEEVQGSPHIKLSPLNDIAITDLLKAILLESPTYEINKFVHLFQGYPLMVTLLADLYHSGQHFNGYINDGSIVERLISCGSTIEPSERRTLQACSLFDVFGVDDGEPRNQAKFIAEKVAKVSIEDFDRTISRFEKRQIINRAGRFARIAPKPLAFTLAAQWWEESNFESQVSLLLDMPASLISTFSTQLTYLDAQPNVQKFSEKLCVHAGPVVV